MLQHPDNKVAAVLHNMQGAPENKLTFEETRKVFALIEASIIARYSGDLERYEDPKDLDITYRPLDTDAIRELLTPLWGEHITAEALEDVFETLTEDGAEEWPQAWCEDDDEHEHEQRSSTIDYEIECTEKQLAKLIEERDQLVGELFDHWYAQEHHRLAD